MMSLSESANPSYFQELLDAVPAGTIATRRSSEIGYLNAESVRLIGYERDQLTSKKIDSLLPDSNAKSHAKLHQTYTARPSAGHRNTGCVRYRRCQDDSECPLAINLRPPKSPTILDSQELLFIPSIDLSCKQLVDHFTKSINASPCRKTLTDNKTTVPAANPSLLKIFGNIKAELMGQCVAIANKLSIQRFKARLQFSPVVATLCQKGNRRVISL
jgi:PAS domain S-box-containing protein